MKHILTTILLGCATISGSAQQINGSFDQEWEECFPWSSVTNNTAKEKAVGTQPLGWKISNVFNSIINMNPVGKQGIEGNNKYVSLTNASLMGQNLPAYITLGTPWSTAQTKNTGTVKPNTADGGTWGGMNFESRPDAISLKYQRTLTDNSTERASVIAYLWRGTWEQTNVPANVTFNVVKYVETTKVTMQNRDKNVLFEEQGLVGDNFTKSQDAELIASKEHYITSATNTWTPLIVDLDYKNQSKECTPTMINVIISANDYFADAKNIKAGNTLNVDDVKLIYRSKLRNVNYNGVSVNGFSSETFDYIMDGDYTPNCISFSDNDIIGRAAVATTNYDTENQTVTITVHNTEGTDEKGESSHTYTFKFAKKEVKNYTNDLSVSLGGITYKPQETTVQLIKETDNTLSFTLKNFYLNPESPIGNIILTGVEKDGNKYSRNQTIKIQPGDDPNIPWVGPYLPEVTVDFNATIIDDVITSYITIPFAGDTIHVIISEITNIVDGEALNLNVGLNNVELNRIFPKGWNTICLPFASTTANFGEGVTAQALTFANENSLTFSNVTTLEANKPYLIYFPAKKTEPTYFGVNVTSTTPLAEDKGIWSFIGTYTGLKAGEMTGKYGVMKNELGSQSIRKAGAGAHINGTRAYFEYHGTANVNSIKLNLEGETTGIGCIENGQLTVTQFPANIYSLDGRLVKENANSLNGLHKGVYIVNNKKVIVK